jgi:hypothetical protein
LAFTASSVASIAADASALAATSAATASAAAIAAGAAVAAAVAASAAVVGAAVDADSDASVVADATFDIADLICPVCLAFPESVVNQVCWLCSAEAIQYVVRCSRGAVVSLPRSVIVCSMAP